MPEPNTHASQPSIDKCWLSFVVYSVIQYLGSHFGGQNCESLLFTKLVPVHLCCKIFPTEKLRYWTPTLCSWFDFPKSKRCAHNPRQIINHCTAIPQKPDCVIWAKFHSLRKFSQFIKLIIWGKFHSLWTKFNPFNNQCTAVMYYTEMPSDLYHAVVIAV